MPKIGARIIKTSVAVLLCLIIEYMISSTVMMYSVIAAILCMQRGMQDSIAVSVERVAGTILGGLAGALLAILFRAAPGIHVLIRYIIISACVIPVIYLSVAFKKERAATLIAIVFLSTALSDSPDPPFLSAMVTTVDTILGIVVTLLVNLVHPAPSEPAQAAAAIAICETASLPIQAAETDDQDKDGREQQEEQKERDA